MQDASGTTTEQAQHSTRTGLLLLGVLGTPQACVGHSE